MFRDGTRINYWYVAAIVLPLLMVSFVGSALYFHQTVVYPVDQIASKIGTGISTADINHKVLILKQAQVELEGYDGNPAWPFPTLYYSFDDFKTQLSTTIIEAESLNVLVGVDDFAYQQGILSVNTAIGALDTRLFYIADAQAYNPYMNSVTFGSLILFGVMFTALPIMDAKRVGAITREEMRARYD